MRTNIYAEEIPQPERIQIIEREVEGEKFLGARVFLELPVTKNGEQIKGPFLCKPGRDSSSAVTFWGNKQQLHKLFRTILNETTNHGVTIDDKDTSIQVLAAVSDIFDERLAAEILWSAMQWLAHCENPDDANQKILAALRHGLMEWDR